MLLSKSESYKWTYCTVGGVVRVNIKNGEDIAHLGELDQKKWTVLSCPAKSLRLDPQTIAFLDSDGDGKIKVKEVVAAAQWLTSVVKDNDSLLKGDSVISLDNIDAQTPEGAKILEAAKVVLACLGSDAATLSVEDAANSLNVFNASKFNGDGIVTEIASEDVVVKQFIQACVSTVGGVMDRSGAQGVNAEVLDKFLAAAQAYLAWLEAGEAGAKTIFPYGADTADAYAGCTALNAKISDYFLRCKLVRFDSDAKDSVDVSSARIQGIADRNLTECVDEIASYPIARPDAGAVLNLDAINPVWADAVGKLRGLVLAEDAKELTEDAWNAILAGLKPYADYMASKAGSEVESLGAEYLKTVLASDLKEQVLGLIAEDSSFAGQAESVASINKLMFLYRDFYRFLNNYVVFSDFYKVGTRSLFEVGDLYIDQRCCNLCIKVEDMGKHAAATGLSGMFLIYCTCTSKTGAKMDIVAVMTDGGIANLRPGKNAVFYDLDGNDWDAVVTKIVDNPINIRKAFWSPYRKLADFVTDKITKKASASESAAVSNLQKTADSVDVKSTPAMPFDIAKFAGIFAAIGLAVGFLMDAIAGIFGYLGGLNLFQIILLLVAIMLVISGPSCFLAWLKLRKRNLGPLLNANGWAINSMVLINTVFGATLTSTAKYPVVRGKDPFSNKTPLWKKILIWCVVIAVIVLAIIFRAEISCFFDMVCGWFGENISGMVPETAPAE